MSDKNTFQSFDSDDAFIGHLLSQKPPEELVEVPEWQVTVLCKSLDAATHYAIQQKALDEKSRKYDYSKVLYEFLMAGCYNPVTGGKIFSESQRAKVMRHSAAVQRLAGTVLRLSSGVQQDSIKKN